MYSASNETDVSSTVPSAWLEAEIQRRCFWAVWITNCINSDHYTVGTSSNDRVMNLPLPANDSSFHQNIQEPPVTLSTVIDGGGRVAAEGQNSSPSVIAELVRLVLIWLVFA